MQEGLPAGWPLATGRIYLLVLARQMQARSRQLRKLAFNCDLRVMEDPAEDTARFAFPAPLSCASARRGRAAVALAASSSAWPSFTGRRRTMREQREMNGDPARRIAAGCSRLSPLGKRRCVAKDFLQAGFSCLQANLHPFA